FPERAVLAWLAPPMGSSLAWRLRRVLGFGFNHRARLPAPPDLSTHPEQVFHRELMQAREVVATLRSRVRIELVALEVVEALSGAERRDAQFRHAGRGECFGDGRV